MMLHAASPNTKGVCVWWVGLWVGVAAVSHLALRNGACCTAKAALLLLLHSQLRCRESVQGLNCCAGLLAAVSSYKACLYHVGGYKLWRLLYQEQHCVCGEDAALQISRH